MIGRTNSGVGGAGGLSSNAAVIHVNAAAGSTITFSKSGVTVKVLGPEKSHVNADDNTLADWYYAVSSGNYGEWTVTATLSGDSASETVTVNATKHYDVELSFDVKIYSPGQLSGFKFKDATYSYGQEYVSLKSKTYRTIGYLVSENAYDFSNCTVLEIECQRTKTEDGIRVGLAATGDFSTSYVAYADATTTARKTLSIDLTNVSPKNALFFKVKTEWENGNPELHIFSARAYKLF